MTRPRPQTAIANDVYETGMGYGILSAMRSIETSIAIIALPCMACALSLTRVCDIERPSAPTSLSSLCFISNGVYWSSTDWKPTLYELTLEMRDGAAPSGLAIKEKCKLQGARDVEGIARDPLRGTVWAVDEEKRELCEYDPTTGRRLGKAAIPSVFDKCRKTYGLESLAIRPDGLEMWLANEESLTCDGNVSNSEDGAMVRLALFTRKNGADAWHHAGQWAYKCDKMDGSAPLDSCRSGLADICVLEDGTMLALEREYSFKPLPSLRCRIYAIDRSAATEVSSCDSLANVPAPFAPVVKTLLYGEGTGFAMFEGIAPGPVEKDGSRLMLLVSDGDKMMSKTIRVLRLAK